MKKILVVDDEESIRILYAVELCDAGYEVFTARNGEEALDMLDKVVPDLVTLDIRMPPGMDGLKVLEKIKEKRRDLPVILSTAYPAYKQDFSAWASDAYIVKSSDLNELMEAVNKILAARDDRRTNGGGNVVGIVMVVMMLALGIGALSANGGMMDHMKEHMGGMMHSAEGKATESSYTAEAEEGGVTVKATYNNPEMKTAPEFAVKLDTHSVDLEGYKLEEIAKLRDEKGQEHAAELVSSSGTGHHREALLRFKDADLSDAKSVELVISGLAGVEKRVLRFDLQMKGKSSGGSKHQH